MHGTGEAEQWYQQQPRPALMGMEATGNSQWFIELVEDLGHVIWIGDAAQIRASYVPQRHWLELQRHRWNQNSRMRPFLGNPSHWS